MKTVNNKTTYTILADQMNAIIEGQKMQSLTKKDFDVALTVTKIADTQIKFMNYELQRAIKTKTDLRELESKPFENTI